MFGKIIFPPIFEKLLYSYFQIFNMKYFQPVVTWDPTFILVLTHF
jgi:hypothetical protein